MAPSLARLLAAAAGGALLLAAAAGPAYAAPVRLPPGTPPRITSRFGPRRSPLTGSPASHGGVDIAAPAGTPVFALAEGTVVAAEPIGSYGLTVMVNHHDGLVSLYAHLQALTVRGGERVPRGGMIGRVGSTGASTGPHLHLEILARRGDRWVRIDPAPWLTGVT